MSDEQTQTPAAAKPSAPAAKASKPSMEERLTALFGRWLEGHVFNSPASRDTEGFNHLQQNALPALRSLILGEIDDNG